MEDYVSKREDEYHNTYIDNIEAQVVEDGRDRDIFYQYSYIFDSEDEGPEELGEDGFTGEKDD